MDKRHSHLSSLIITGQITREEALYEISKPMYDEKQMEVDVKMVLEKLGMSRNEFEELISRPGKQHTDYPTDKCHIWFDRLLTFW